VSSLQVSLLRARPCGLVSETSLELAETSQELECNSRGSGRERQDEKASREGRGCGRLVCAAGLAVRTDIRKSWSTARQ
jgi:hypothetical protein